MRISDWSSDVCSSDLSPHLRLAPPGGERDGHDQPRRVPAAFDRAAEIITHAAFHQQGAETGTLRLGNRAFPAAFGPAQAELAIVHILARSEEHTSELQSLMRISYAVFCFKKKKNR